VTDGTDIKYVQHIMGTGYSYGRLGDALEIIYNKKRAAT
jgi:hypothetical protein